jgi:hypothetical protein
MNWGSHRREALSKPLFQIFDILQGTNELCNMAVIMLLIDEFVKLVPITLGPGVIPGDASHVQTRDIASDTPHQV